MRASLCPGSSYQKGKKKYSFTPVCVASVVPELEAGVPVWVFKKVSPFAGRASSGRSSGVVSDLFSGLAHARIRRHIFRSIIKQFGCA